MIRCGFCGVCTDWSVYYGKSGTLVADGIFRYVRFKITTRSVLLEHDMVEKIMTQVFNMHPDHKPKVIAASVADVIYKERRHRSDVKIVRRAMSDSHYKYYITIDG